jgi:hypothetical protein
LLVFALVADDAAVRWFAALLNADAKSLRTAAEPVGKRQRSRRPQKCQRPAREPRETVESEDAGSNRHESAVSG